MRRVLMSLATLLMVHPNAWAHPGHGAMDPNHSHGITSYLLLCGALAVSAALVLLVGRLTNRRVVEK